MEMFSNELHEGRTFVSENMDAFLVVKGRNPNILEIDQPFQADLESKYILYVRYMESE